MYVAVPEHYTGKLKEKKGWQIFEPFQSPGKAVKHDDGNTNCCWSRWNGYKRLRKETWCTGNKWKNCDHPDNSSSKISLDA